MGYITSKHGMTHNNESDVELERRCKQYLKVPPQNLPCETEESHMEDQSGYLVPKH